jgi:hypothetical protein
MICISAQPLKLEADVDQEGVNAYVRCKWTSTGRSCLRIAIAAGERGGGSCSVLSGTGQRIGRRAGSVLEVAQIEWRVMNTTKNGQPIRGQIVPYADQRAYTDRLNALFTPAGWTRKYTIHTSANFERSKDQKIVAKVMVTCEGHPLRPTN